jgi:hypothetical protein
MFKANPFQKSDLFQANPFSNKELTSPQEFVSQPKILEEIEQPKPKNDNSKVMALLESSFTNIPTP